MPNVDEGLAQLDGERLPRWQRIIFARLLAAVAAPIFFRSFAIGLTPTPSVFLHLGGALVPVRVYMSGARTVHAVSPPPDSETHHEISDGIAEP